MNCYAAFVKHEETRKKGSSGGIFPLLARAHINNGGVVYASIYDEHFNVVFKRIEDNELLEKSFGSKYLQSRLNDTFLQVEKDLKENRDVIFCGTPCQATGLSKYLEKKRINRERLLIIDIICHGVPSEDVFHKFINTLFESSCTYINMRNKDLGWNWGRYSWEMHFADGSQKIIPQADVAYMKGFIANLYLRPSCYQCKAKSNNASDITLGDFWGISRINPDFHARFGVSCVICRTPKGEQVFTQSKEDVEHFTVNYSDILAGNPSLESSVKKPIYRSMFFKKINSCSDNEFESVINSLVYPSFAHKIANKVYKMLPESKTTVSDIVNKNEKTIYNIKENCCGCTACLAICKANAIMLKKDGEGFFYPVIDSNKCVNCKQCEQVCSFISKNN